MARLAPSTTEPGGKGVNVARAVAAAGVDVLAVLPAAADDPFVRALTAIGLPPAVVPVPSPVRTNYTLTEPDGTTTKLNEPGAALDDDVRTALGSLLTTATFLQSSSAKPNFFANRYMISWSVLHSKIGSITRSRHWMLRFDAVTEPCVSNCVVAGRR